LETVLCYARFLRDESGLAADDVLDLAKLRARFGMPAPKLAKLPNQQGLLVNAETGAIVINETDIQARQRFTEAHEFMELLFITDEASAGWSARRTFGAVYPKKEIWCDAGAAELLMPVAKVHDHLTSAGISFAVGSGLAAHFHASLFSAMRQMVQASTQKCAVVLWKMGYTKDEQKVINRRESQGSLFALSDSDGMPTRQLRVTWREQNCVAPYIPLNKSIEEDSAVHIAFRDRVFTSGDGMLDLGRDVIRFFAENQPYLCDSENAVLSLLYFR
jgi:hypothetical protein